MWVKSTRARWLVVKWCIEKEPLNIERVKNQEDITNGEEYNAMFRWYEKKCARGVQKRWKIFRCVIWGERKKFSKISYLISFVRHTRDENVPPTNFLVVVVFNNTNTNRLTYLCHWHWAVFILGILRVVVHRSIPHLFLFLMMFFCCFFMGERGFFIYRLILVQCGG